MGEIISTSGVPATDPFSYTMPSFPFIDHEWLTNVLIKNAYYTIGYFGLAAFYAGLGILAVVTALYTGSKKLKYTQIPLFLGLATVFTFSGIRPQVESWLFLAIFLPTVVNERIFQKARFLLPALFVVWVNLHGSFALGIASLFLIIATKTFQRQSIRELLPIFLLSILATFINPYGPRIWHEVWLQVSDTSLRWSILEWQPAFFSLNIPFLLFGTLTTMLTFRFRRKFELKKLVIFFFFLFLAIGSVRHIPLFVIASISILAQALNFLHDEVKEVKLGEVRFKKIYNVASTAFLIVFLISAGFGIRGAGYFGEETFYPAKGLVYLKENPPPGQIFSEYGWGGYLIWKMPQKKVFIDGRMPSWRWDENKPLESSYAMKDYKNLLSGEVGYKEIFDKYNISTVFWPAPKPESSLEVLDKKIRSHLVNLGFYWKEYDLLKELKSDGWQRVYEDKAAVIYERPE